jgi:hypothetical protein
MTFTDYINTDYIFRVYGGLKMRYIVSNGLIKILDVFHNYDNLHTLRREMPDTKIKIKYFGIIDLETYNDSNNNKTPYAIGIYYKNIFKSFYLSDYFNTSNNIEEQIKYMIIDCLKYIKKNNIKILYAHNGGLFDFKLLLYFGLQNNNFMVDNYNLIIKEEFIRFNRIYSLKLKFNDFNFQLKDSYLLLPLSLEALCKDFCSDTKKGIFPHKFVHYFSLNYVGSKPCIDGFYKIDQKDYDDFPQQFNLREVCLQYLEKDCKSLYEIITKFQLLL